jgi:CRP-like cAMP-binding protein
MRTLASLLNLGAGAVRAARGRRSTLGRHMPWRDHKPATQVMAAGTALERRLSRQLIAAGPSVRTLRRGATLVKQGAAGDELFLLLEGSLAVEVDGHRVGEVGPGAVLEELAVLEHDLVVVGVVPARLRDRADLVAMAAMLGANPYQVAARLDHWRFGPTVALTVASLPVQRFRQVKPRLGAMAGLRLTRYPGQVGRRTATLRALTSCRVAVVPDGVLDREALADLAERRRFMPHLRQATPMHRLRWWPGDELRLTSEVPDLGGDHPLATTGVHARSHRPAGRLTPLATSADSREPCRRRERQAG